jgi:hypothetical protein
MKIRVGGLAAIVGAAALCVAVPAFGQVNMELTGTNDGTYGSDYAGFYQGTIGTQPNVNIVCDDYGDNVSVGQVWTANVLNASLIPANLSSTMFGTTGSAIGVIGYAEVATLVEDMFTATSSAQRDDLSAAIWYITSGGASAALDPGAQIDYNTVTAEFGGNTTAADTALDGDTNLWLYTPIGPNGLHSSQEFWGESVPEGGTALLYLLLAGASCFGAMLFSSRNQFGKRETA